MLKVAIIEDNLPFQSRINNLINNSHCIEFVRQIDVFSNAEEFLIAISNSTYHIIILDIELPGMSGLELSRKLIKVNKETSIIFLTSYGNYALDAFGLNVHKYIMKDQADEKLINAITEIINSKMNQKVNQILVKSYAEDLLVNEDEIICIIYEDRHPVIYMSDRKIVVTGSSLEKILKKLNSINFVQPNNGAIINFNYMKSLSSKSIVLHDYESQLIISRGRYEAVKEKYMKYLMLGEVINNG